ncbi:mannose-1-phosphate guanylyltransferase [Algoriphagus sp. A40]|uniref:mannose-1-phosphate guanylyltransferase n=1 Tax=Algoriphagus sp. A40 TaxID=1945863 RepID=UPI00098614F9|nr:sugar phosphate nucleotidyltransferase [Algoriphagus sp. A40]OOG68931.1 mannose-1-phosphate guanylyltransferase [Algoriphagus sp. A40]
MKIINVILSGGVGSRLWPLSRKSRPKQYLSIFEGHTLFQKTALRNKEYCDEVIVVGNCDNFELSRKDLDSAEIKDYTEIIEACPRNTAAAIAFAAFDAHPEDILFVTPSDHLIKAEELYASAVSRATQLADEGYIVTFGLKPTKPETGYGYIESEGENVKSFREKPDLKTAQSFLEQGNFFWNSGMFCFKAGVFLQELQEFEPEVFMASKKVFDNSDSGKLDYDLSMKIPSISVDYAVMERTKKIKMVPSLFRWSDMGSFESIYEYLEGNGYPKDEFGNMVIGTDVHTEFTGLTNTILIQTSDAILVLRKENAQDVKKIFERLEKDRPELV